MRTIKSAILLEMKRENKFGQNHAAAKCAGVCTPNYCSSLAISIIKMTHISRSVMFIAFTENFDRKINFSRFSADRVSWRKYNLRIQSPLKRYGINLMKKRRKAISKVLQTKTSRNRFNLKLMESVRA